MKTAIYIEDNFLRVTITPESAFEKRAFDMFQGQPARAKIFSDGEHSLILQFANPPEPQTPVEISDELNERLDVEARAGENYIRGLANINETIVAAAPRSDAE